MKALISFILFASIVGCQSKLQRFEERKAMYNDSIKYYEGKYDEAMEGLDSTNFDVKRKEYNKYFRLKMNARDSVTKYTNLYTNELNKP